MRARAILVLLALAGPGFSQESSAVVGSVRIPAEVAPTDVRVELMYSRGDLVSPEDERLEARTDGQGAFRFEEVRQGQLHLLARAPGWVSAPLDLGLSRAARVEGLALPLERAARVHASLRDSSGAADAGRSVTLVWRETLQFAGVTGPAGELELGGIPSGPVEVHALPTEAEVTARAGVTGAPLDAVRRALLRTRRFELAPGEAAELRLAPLPRALARLRGRLFLSPSGRHVVVARNESLGTVVSARAAVDGSYELWLPGPGSFQLEALVPFGAAGLSHFEDVVVQDAEHVHDIHVPLGQLEILVQERTGEPCAGAEVWCRMEQGAQPSEPWFLARPDGAGRLELLYTPAYRLGFSATLDGRAGPWTSVTIQDGARERIVLFVER